MMCAACGRPALKHDLAEARACLAAIARNEPPYCRLTGPTDRQAWAREVAARWRERIEHPERFEI
jgi:hypothetical protein